jgi:hypothetical protein
MFVIIPLILGSLALAATILLYPTPPGVARAWTLRTSWALWCLQPALLFGALIASLAIRGAMGYSSSDVPADVESWLTFVIVGPVGVGLLAGTVLGGLAWRSARSERPPTSKRRWALAALVANALWFAGGAWLMLASAVAVGLDVLIVVVVLALLLWPLNRPAVDSPTPHDGGPLEAPDGHLVG